MKSGALPPLSHTPSCYDAYTHVGSYQIPRCYVPEGRGHSYRSYFPSSSSSLYGRNCRGFDLGFTFMSVYIYTYQCELVLSAKLQLQRILVNTWSVSLYNVETHFLAYFIQLLDKPNSLRSDLLPSPARKIRRQVFFNRRQINPRYEQLSDHRRTGWWRCLFPYCEISSPSAVRNTWFHLIRFCTGSSGESPFCSWRVCQISSLSVYP